MTKICQVVCDSAQGVRECALQLPDEANITQALVEARRALGECAVDWESAPTGIYGRMVSRQHVPNDGDRIELYRALQLDPRSSRRARAARTMAGRGRGGSGQK
jgi:uncharacterized protein